MKTINLIIKKELTRVFADKKLVVSLFVLPVVLIIGIYTLIGQMQKAMLNDIEKHTPIIYIQNEPEGFSDYIKTTGFDAEITGIKADDSLLDYKQKVMEGTIDTIVIFEEGFLDKIINYKEGDLIPEVKTYYNPSEDYSNKARNQFVETVLLTYQKQLLSGRIGNLNNILVFNIDLNPEESVIIDEEKATGKFLGMLLPYFITMMLFAGAMSLGVDAITGEKERGTLASMLITPIKRSEIVMGKLLSLTILSCMSAAVYAISMVIIMPMMLENLSGGETEGVVLTFSSIQIAQLLVIMLVLVFLYVSIVSLVAVFAKTAKEANTYVSPMYILVIVAGMITMFQKGDAGLFYHAIPIYGSAVAIQKLLIGELPVMAFLTTIGSTIVAAGLLVFIITKAFHSEKVMFNA
ncbi:sodium transport system permease protein [Mobilisporobacter senegalensis]|uniref:Sodium transport system permease protein n=1 Tax=Mobilisporobacter senegalensis TaxID=1329262 RepID=A0A3N1XG40_9FIRM|nr:ABC transporter permease [Mobilisporobacter senegalensis]ROR25684.1 sodium transport system permease protein [Mobilisporobacter senegalensis]